MKLPKEGEAGKGKLMLLGVLGDVILGSLVTLVSLVFLGLSGKFWYVASNGTVCSDGERSEDFFFEFRESSRVAIKGKNGKYLRGDQAGTLRADAETLHRATLWEY